MRGKPKLFMKPPNNLYDLIILWAHTYTPYEIQTIGKTALEAENPPDFLSILTNSNFICRWKYSFQQFFVNK